MREILFRGKRTDNGEWVEGYFVAVNSKCYIGQEVTENTKSVSCLNGTWYGFDNFYEVIPETVGEYTGLTDRNNKKIFEGDIVKDNLSVIYEIIYDEANFQKKDIDLDYGYVLERSTDLIVIGNIHDNSEILKGGAEE